MWNNNFLLSATVNILVGKFVIILNELTSDCEALNRSECYHMTTSQNHLTSDQDKKRKTGILIHIFLDSWIQETNVKQSYRWQSCGVARIEAEIGGLFFFYFTPFSWHISKNYFCSSDQLKKGLKSVNKKKSNKM